MRTFSKLVFICNCCFIIAATLRILEINFGNSNLKDALVKLPALVASIILLGLFLSLILNIIFVALVATKKLKHSTLNISNFLLYFNVVLLPIQIWYSFIAN